MAIAKVPAPEPALPLPTPPAVKSEVVMNEVVNAGYTPLKSLMTNVAGKPWMSTFLNQILGPGSEPMPPQFDTSDATQSYRRIRKFVLKVTTDLQRNPNPKEGETELSGTAHIMPGIVPNVYDAFYADIGDGRMGLFVINNVEQMSVYNDTAYYIEYGLFDYVTPEIDAEINGRVVQDTVYDMDFAHTGKNPIIAYDEYFTRERLAREELGLVDHFFSQFFDKEVGTFSVPDDNTWRRLYDPFHTRFVDRLIEHEKRPPRLRLLVLDESLGAHNQPVTVFDMLVKQDVRQFKYVARNMQLLSAQYFRGGSVLMGGVAYSGMDDIIYPKTEYTPSFDNDLTGDASTNGDPEGLMFREIHMQDNYILSEAFYEQRKVEMTMLEREVHNLITQQPISVDNVDQLLNAYYDVPKLVQYYAFPFLVTLCRTAAQRLV